MIRKLCVALMSTTLICIFMILFACNTTKSIGVDIVKKAQNNVTEDLVIVPSIVYDGLTRDQLVEKIEKSLNSTVSGYGYLFVDTCLEYGVDPYLAVAIMLHETGCKWTCSRLVRYCNNVGGMVGKPSCGGGSYKAFDTLEDGITSFVRNLYINYINKGLTDAELISNKYTGTSSTSWPIKVNSYIESIKSK